VSRSSASPFWVADVVYVVVVGARCSLSADSFRYDARRDSLEEGSYVRDAADMEGRDSGVRRDAWRSAAMDRANGSMTVLLGWQRNSSGLFEM
jgi:hypothetical protein